MRTTLILEDGLFKKAKQEAVEAGVTLSEVMNTALRQHLRGVDRKRSRTVFAMPVFGEERPMHQTPAQLAALRDEGR